MAYSAIWRSRRLSLARWAEISCFSSSKVCLGCMPGSSGETNILASGTNGSAMLASGPKGGGAMIKRFDHLTIVVNDVAEAKRFFGLLGFKEAISIVISGATFARYMGVAGIEAEHVTLVAEGVEPRTE